MGMDVFGRQPTAEVGEYFRNNVWWWRPLAELCKYFAPETCAKCTHWHSNDGDGLDAEGALALADALDTALKNGGIAEYIKDRDEFIAALPDKPCELCNGTGVRCDALGVELGFPERVIDEEGHPRFGQKGWCNSCEGKGAKPDWMKNYPCDAENVAEFVAFLRACGGFNIH